MGYLGVAMSNTFEVIFSGEVLDGFDAAETRAKVGQLFKADEAKLARLFSGKPVVIKKGLDEATANKYVGAFKKAGAKAIAKDAAAPAPVEAITAAPPPVETQAPAAKPSPAPAAKPAPSSGSPVNTSTFEHSGEASEHLTEAPKTQVQLDANPDLSGIEMRDLTGNLVDAKADVPDANIDTSEFSLAATGSDIGVQKDEPEEYNPDLSGITLADN